MVQIANKSFYYITTTYLIHSPLASLRSKPPHSVHSPKLLVEIFRTVIALCLFRDDPGESGHSFSVISLRALMWNECALLTSLPVAPCRESLNAWWQLLLVASHIIQYSMLQLQLNFRYWQKKKKQKKPKNPNHHCSS